MNGTFFLSGNLASAEGAIAAGCRFFSGYPITPSSEIAERMCRRLPALGGTFLQMEDELASSIAMAGASWGGLKAMTATSGPGLSLMAEHIGFCAMTETPVVLIDVQRAGPSTGLPTLVGAGDMMQARWGSHGDYEIIALSPWSPQEAFDLTVRAFNLAERYRTPVLVLADEMVGHMVERVAIPPAEEIEIVDRRRPTDPSAGLDEVPPMALAGEGCRVMVTGLTHDERGHPALDADSHERLVRRLVGKIRNAADDLEDVVATGTDEARVVVVAYGITGRVAAGAVGRARAAGRPVGLLRLRTIWPFPATRLAELADRVRALVVPEINLGQVVLEVERVAAGRCRVLPVGHPGGRTPPAEAIAAAIEEGLR